MGRLITCILTTVIFAACAATADQPQKTAAVTKPKADLTNWQTVVIEGKSIKFRLPPNWRHDDTDLKNSNEFFTHEAYEWHTQEKDLVRFFIATYPRGFLTNERKPASKEEMLQEKLDSWLKDPDLYKEVKKVKLGAVEGAFSVMEIDLGGDTGKRKGINWTGYRIYEGNPQEVEIQISSTPDEQKQELLRTILDTIEVEDKPNK
jgi:hypothetical protein